MVNVTLFSEDFAKLHNTLCQLRTFRQSLTGDSLFTLQVTKVDEIVKSFEDSLKSAYEQEDKIQTRRGNHYSEVQEKYNLEAIWSVEHVESLFEMHPFTSAKTVSYPLGTHWGGKDIQVEIPGNTWLSLYLAADEAICKSGDMHHIFIEVFEPEGENLILRTGS
jgi:hypothetical protein